MKKLIILIGLLLTAGLPLEAQTFGTDTVGVNLMDSSSLVAPYVDFGRSVYSMHLSPRQDYLLVMFRDTNKKKTVWKNKGEIGVLRLEDRQLMWTQPFNYSTTQAALTNRGVLTMSGCEVKMLGKRTGNTVWEQYCNVVHVMDSAGVVLAYASPTSSKLSAYSIDDGTLLWTNRVPHDKNWGWNDVGQEDSVHIMLACDDLVRLNVLTGDMQEHEAKTGVTDVKGALLQGLIGVAGATLGAAATGSTYYYSPVYVAPNIISGLHSNVVRADSIYYFADREHVVCLDSLLQPLWQHELPAKTATQSTLLADDSLLYMFNYGFGLNNGGLQKKAGRPFIYVFDRRTGQPLVENILTARKDIVADARISPTGVYMMFDDGMAYKADLRTPDVTITPWDYKQYGRLTAMSHSTCYTYFPLKGAFMPLEDDGQNCPVMTDKGDVYIVNERLDIWQRFNNEQLYIPIYKSGDRRWVYHRYPVPDLWIIHQLGMPEVHVTANVRRICATDDNLYLLVGDHILFLDTRPQK